MESLSEQIENAIQLLISNNYQVRKRPKSTYDYSVSVEDIEHEWIQAILRDVSFCNNIEIEDILIKSRDRKNVESRQIAHHIAHKLKYNINITLASIGYRIGGKDHATVLHSAGVVLNLIHTDKNYQNKYASIIKMYNLDK